MIRPLLFFLVGFFFISLSSLAQEVASTMWVVDGGIQTMARSGNTAYLGGNFKYIGQLTGGGAMLDRVDGQLVNHRSLKMKGEVMTAASDGQGGWYIGGTFTEIQGVPRDGLAHILADNSLDVNWKFPIKTNEGRPYPFITNLMVANNVLYVGGGFEEINAIPRYQLAAIDLVTSQVTAWSPRIYGKVQTMICKDNLLYVGGDFSSIDGQRKYLAALDPHTGVPTSWAPVVDASISGIACIGHTLYLSGNFGLIEGAVRRGLAAINLPTGKVLPWNPSVEGSVDVLLTKDTVVFAGGRFDGIAGKPRKNLAAIDATTGMALEWNAGIQPNLHQHNIQLFDNTIYIGGGIFDGKLQRYLAAVDATTGQKVEWDPGVDGWVHCIAASEKSVYVGGDFNSAGGKFRNNVVAINVVDNRITEWAPDANWTINKLLSSNGLVYAGGHFSSIGGEVRNGLAALHPITGKSTSWNPNIRTGVNNETGSAGYVGDLAIANGLVYVGGEFTRVNGENRKNLAAIDLVSGKANAWNPGSNHRVNGVALFNHLVYVGGDFSTINGKSRIGLASIHKVTGQVTNWNPGLEFILNDTYYDGTIRTLKLVNSTLYANGYYTSLGGQAKNGLAAIDLNNGKVMPWSPESSEGYSALAIIDTIVYAPGGYYPNGQYKNAFSTISGKKTAWNIHPLPVFAEKAVQIVNSDGYVYLEGAVEGLYDHDNLGEVEVFNVQSYEETVSPALGNFVQGKIFRDINRDCMANENEEKLSDIVVMAEPGPYYGISDSLGNYSIRVDTGTYTIRQLLFEDKAKLIQQTCPASNASHTVTFKSYNNTITGKDFGDQVTLVPYLTSNLTSTRRRRCFSSTTDISYCNSGSASASDVKVHLQLPEYVVMVSANVPYTVDKDKNYVFNIGTLNPNQCGKIQVLDSVVCNDPDIRGLTQCTKVWMTPASTPAPSPNWDQSDITLKAMCLENGRVRLGIYNSGIRAMSDSSTYRIYADASLVLKRQFKLVAGDSLVLQVPANGQTIRLEAEQRPDHPTKQSTNVTIEACGTNALGKVSLGYVAQLPPDDTEPEVDIECLPITDSFDPNDKLVLPAGVSSEHYTSFGQELEYTVRFQNTGNDYAYRVEVVDTLADHLDVSTLRVVNASHPYQFTVSGKGYPVLTWTFEGINLPDSAHDQAGSNGFVKFKILPNKALSEGTRIENEADIFFDYNPPLRTNTVYNTLYTAPDTQVAGNTLVVTICKPNQPVTLGMNHSFCKQDTVRLQAQHPTYGSGRWKRISGAGTIQDVDDVNTLITHLAYGSNVFEWSIPNGTCATDSLHSRVTVTRYRNPEKPGITLEGVNGLTCSIEAESYQWYFNNRLLSANDKSITATKVGKYAVKVTMGDCTSDLSDLYDFKLTSTVLMLLVNVYPNPTVDELFVELPQGIEEVTTVLVDALGREVVNRNTESSGPHPIKQKFNLSHLRAGLYFVKIKTNEVVIVKRIVLE